MSLPHTFLISNWDDYFKKARKLDTLERMVRRVCEDRKWLFISMDALSRSAREYKGISPSAHSMFKAAASRLSELEQEAHLTRLRSA